MPVDGATKQRGFEMATQLPIGTRVMWEAPDPRGTYWPTVLMEGRVYEHKAGSLFVSINTGVYANPPSSDLRRVYISALVY